MGVSKKTAAKMGLMSAIMVIFGAVIGIGIFFKNGGVFVSNNNNYIGVLVSWIISIFLVLCLALSFGQIVSCKTRGSNAGLGGWSERFNGYKIGRFTKICQSLGYYTFQTYACLMFAGEAIVNMIVSTVKKGEIAGSINFKGQALAIFGAGLAMILIFASLNYFASKAAQKFGSAISYFKFLPMALVIIFGIVGGCISGENSGGLWVGNIYDGTKWGGEVGSFTILGSIMAIPSILFAFEGYLVIGNIASEIDNPEKKIPLAIVLGIVMISVLNLLLTIACITAGTGNVYHLMNLVFGNGSVAARTMNITFSIFLFICVLGVCNGMICASMRSVQSSVEQKILFKSEELLNKKPGDPLFGGMVYYLGFTMFTFVATLIPSIFVKSDQIIDGLGNTNVVVFYLLYGIVVLGGFINVFTKKVNVTKSKGFAIYSAIGALGAIFIFGFCAIYQFTVCAILKPHAYDVASWGLFVDMNKSADGDKVATALQGWQVAITFWSIALYMFSLPFINDLMIKLFDKKPNREPLLWEKIPADFRAQLAQLN